MRYSLATTPLAVAVAVAVADYTYDALPSAARDAVPTDTELAAAAGAAFTQLDAGASHPPHVRP